MTTIFTSVKTAVSVLRSPCDGGDILCLFDRHSGLTPIITLVAAILAVSFPFYSQSVIARMKRSADVKRIFDIKEHAIDEAVKLASYALKRKEQTIGDLGESLRYKLMIKEIEFAKSTIFLTASQVGIDAHVALIAFKTAALLGDLETAFEAMQAQPLRKIGELEISFQRILDKNFT